jgi:hypothetical protein
LRRHAPILTHSRLLFAMLNFLKNNAPPF